MEVKFKSCVKYEKLNKNLSDWNITFILAHLRTQFSFCKCLMAFFWFSSYENKLIKENSRKMPLSMTSLRTASTWYTNKNLEIKVRSNFPGFRWPYKRVWEKKINIACQHFTKVIIAKLKINIFLDLVELLQLRAKFQIVMVSYSKFIWTKIPVTTGGFQLRISCIRSS